MNYYIYKVVFDWKGPSTKNQVSKLALGASIYAIWRERNNRCFLSQSLPKEVVFNSVYRTCRDKGAFFSNMNQTKESEKIANAWGLPCCIFKAKKL